MPGLTSRLMNRWSCSYIEEILILSEFSSFGRVWSALSSSTARGNHRILIHIGSRWVQRSPGSPAVGDWRCPGLLVMRRLSLPANRSAARASRERTQHKLRVLPWIDSPIQIPFSLHLDIRFIHPNWILSWFQSVDRDRLSSSGSISLDPSIHRRMGLL